MESVAPLVVRVESGNGSATIALNGELDMQTVPVLEDHLAQVEVGEVEEITLDLRDVTSSTRWRFMRSLRHENVPKEHGRRLILVGVGPPARRLLELTDTQYLLHGDPWADPSSRKTRSPKGGMRRPCTSTPIAPEP